MNSKQNIDINSASKIVPGLDQEEHLLVAALEAKISKLTQICDELNPYQEIPLEMQKELNAYGIQEFNNPFQLTNTLVMLLEDAIDELHQLKPFQIDDNL